MAEHSDTCPHRPKLAFTAFLKKIFWRQIYPQQIPRNASKFERHLTEPTSWGIFPRPIIRLLELSFAEQHDEWIEGRRYLGLRSSPSPIIAAHEKRTKTRCAYCHGRR